MPTPTLFRGMLIPLVGILLVGGSGCRSNSPTQTGAISAIAPTSSPVQPSPAPSVAVPSTEAQQIAYKQALEKANSAQNLSRNALSEDDWNLVMSRWQQAVNYLKSLPPSSPYQAIGKAKLAEFEKGLAIAKQKATQAKSAANAAAVGTIAGIDSLKVTSETTTAISGKVFQAKIKRRAAGTPIIDVTFNGKQTFEMIVDTGASSTVITQEMANSLGVKVVGKTKVNTASQTGVEVPLAFVDSIAVGGAVVKEVIVAIGNNALDVGLLGHDFFSDYDVTVKQDVVEFRRR